MNKIKYQLLKGLFTTIIIGTVALLYFYGPLLKNPNNVYFAKDFDGLQNYYGNIYHIKYDSTYMRTSAMNYPYGEMVYFTGVQLIPSSIMKFISKHFIDISAYYVGFQNIFMLISIVIAAVFIFLIFYELGIGWLPSALAAIFIAFLAPQVDRFGGHFSLAYVFVLPVFFYLIIRFHKKQKFIISWIISLYSFWAFTTHMYFCAMFGTILLFYWLYYYFKIEKKLLKALIHLFIQLLLPFLIMQLLGVYNDNVNDRTNTPWGFLDSRAYPKGVFLPFGKPYGQFLYHIFKSTNYISWEGIAYVGLVGLFTFMVIVKRWAILIKRKQFSDIFSPSENKIIDLLFWGSFALLIYSFGIPFIFGLQWLINYIGPLKQMRAIGRFTWPFYFIINIIGIYIIWKYSEKKGMKSLIWIALLILGYDSFIYSNGRYNYLNNKFSEIEDVKNLLPQDSWAHKITSTKFQAIISIPPFHLGSENIWIAPKCENLANTMLVSIKTGIPIVDIYYSRTSISQSYNSIQLTGEPYRHANLLNDCHNEKPFLIVKSNCDSYSNDENKLVSLGDFLYKNDKFSLYKVSYNSILHWSDSLYNKTKEEFSSKKLNKFNDIYSSDSEKDFVYLSFDNNKCHENPYLGNGCLSLETKGYQQIYNEGIPNCDTSKQYIISFWYGNILTDLFMRSTLIVTLADSTGKTYHEDWLGIGSCFKILDNNWALIEVKFKFKYPNDKLRLTLKSSNKLEGNFLVDELIIRKENCRIYKLYKEGIIKNNRYYIKTQN
jgi:hypothetical protein